jgi:hypothetical protein
MWSQAHGLGSFAISPNDTLYSVNNCRYPTSINLRSNQCLLTLDRPIGHDSFADTPWTNTLVEYTAKILTETSVRVIGVCFGHQIVGRALKAGVGRNPDGWEAAVNDVQLSEKGKEVFGVDSIVSPFTPFLSKTCPASSQQYIFLGEVKTTLFTVPPKTTL